jgi:predicted nucleotidyltransferase
LHGAPGDARYLPGVAGQLPGKTGYLPGNTRYKMTKLGLLFYSDLRADIFSLLFGVRPSKMYRAEIIGLTRFAKGSVEEELQKLVDLELLVTSKESHRRYYSANTAHPLYPELRSIVLKTAGLRVVLLEALSSEKIQFAFVFGSLAAVKERAESDLDLMIIGSAGHRDLATPLRGLTERLGREINPHFFTLEELNRRLAVRDHFLSDVLAKPKLFIIGDEHEFTDLVKVRVAPGA